MKYFKELQGFPIHIPIKKTYCPVYDADFRRKIYGGKRKI